MIKAQIEIVAGEHERFSPNMKLSLAPGQRLVAIHPDRIVLEVDIDDPAAETVLLPRS